MFPGSFWIQKVFASWRACWKLRIHRSKDHPRTAFGETVQIRKVGLPESIMHFWMAVKIARKKYAFSICVFDSTQKIRIFNMHFWWFQDFQKYAFFHGKMPFFLAGARCLSAGHHLRLTRGPAGNRTTTGSLSASSRTTPYQLSHEDTYWQWHLCVQFTGWCACTPSCTWHE